MLLYYDIKYQALPVMLTMIIISSNDGLKRYFKMSATTLMLSENVLDLYLMAKSQAPPILL